MSKNAKVTAADPVVADGVTEPVQEKGLAGFAQKLAAWFEKWFPDAFIFALAGVVLLVVANFLNGAKPAHVFMAVGNGFWDLLAFSLQMAMVVLTGYVVATSDPMRKLIEKLAMVPKGPRVAVMYVALMSCAVSYVSWGLSIVFGGLLARAIARRKDMRVDYRAIGAAAFMGLGAIWALGLSSSAAQMMTNKASMPEAVYKVSGILDFGKTIFEPESIASTIIITAVTAIICFFSAPRSEGAKTAEMLGVDLDDTVEVTSTKHDRPGEFLEYKWWLPAFIGVMVVGWWIVKFRRVLIAKGDVFQALVSMASNLNEYLMVFLVLGMVLHGTPHKFMAAVQKAIPSTAGVLVQFPLYAVMARLMTEPVGSFTNNTLSHLLSGLFTSVGHDAFPFVLSLYTIILGILVPSGGGKWAVEAPYVMDAANRLQYNLGWTVEVYNISEAIPNLVNPFFMLPLLAIMKVRARELVGYTFVQFIFHLPLVLFLCWVLGKFLGYELPIGVDGKHFCPPNVAEGYECVVENGNAVLHKK